MDDDVKSPEDAFASWLRTFYNPSTTPKFEIGSLAFLRSHSHQVLLEHFDRLGSHQNSELGDLLVPTISASMFLPQKSVWNFRQKDRSHATRPRPAESTPEPRLKLWHRMKRAVRNDSYAKSAKQRSGSLKGAYSCGLQERFALWNMIAEDFGRQESIPGLQSGNTVVDERNFVPS